MSAVGTLAPYHANSRLSGRAIALVVGLHLVVLWGLARYAPSVLPEPLQVLTVSILPPTPEVKPEPRVTPPHPKPVESRPRPVQQPQQIASPQESPAPSPVAVPPAPTFSSPTAPTAVSAPLTQPRFDAEYLDNPKPPYPSLSRRLNEQGRVVLRVHVLAGGSVDDVQLQTSSGFARLDHSALDTVRRWKFAPARRGSEAVAAWVLVPIVFTLKES